LVSWEGYSIHIGHGVPLNAERTFLPWPSFTEEEAVYDVLLSNKVNYWTGQECREFEREFADFSDAEYAIAVANGTLGIGSGPEGAGYRTG